MSDDNMNNTPTILDRLNKDCLWNVLDYVPIEAIIRSERVSQRWQTVVLDYLRHARIHIHCYLDYLPDLKPSHNACILRDVNCSSFECWTNKLGPSVVAAFCTTERIFKIIGENCPNAEDITFGVSEKILLRNQYENFKWLQRICFRGCRYISDRFVKRYMSKSHIGIQQFAIHKDVKITGECLININWTNLKSLSLICCVGLQFHYLLTAANQFNELMKFELYIPHSRDAYKDIHLVLDKLPKLEYLRIFGPKSRLPNFCESVCRLSLLEHLNVNYVDDWTDSELEAVTRCCKKLKILILGQCYSMTGKGLEAVCRNAGERLTVLGVRDCVRLSNDDVVACISSCYNLTLLDVSGDNNSQELTQDLIARAAAARRGIGARRRLRLRCCHWGKEEYNELIRFNKDTSYVIK